MLGYIIRFTQILHEELTVEIFVSEKKKQILVFTMSRKVFNETFWLGVYTIKYRCKNVYGCSM